MPGSTISILNGIIGNFLEDSGNELATQMNFYWTPHQNQPAVDPDLFHQRLSSVMSSKNANNSSNKPCLVVVLIHGLICDETSWTFTQEEEQVDYGSLLQRDLTTTFDSTNANGNDVIPLYLRYNTGLHISHNGHKLSQLLELLLGNHPNDIGNKNNVKIAFVCHSMGGLVARSATLSAMKHHHTWLKRACTMIFMGTPHGGSYWEKAGHFIAGTLNKIPRPSTKLLASVANLRSDGIKDLRRGTISEEEWLGSRSSSSSTLQQPLDELLQQAQQYQDDWLVNPPKTTPTDLVDWVSYHIVTGTITADPSHPLSLVFGDGLVSKSSAEGRCDHKRLEFARSSSTSLSSSSSSFRNNENDSKAFYQEFPGVHHNSLLKNMHVYRHVKEWVEQSASLPEEATQEEEEEDDGFVLVDDCNLDEEDVSDEEEEEDSHMITTTTSSHDAIIVDPRSPTLVDLKTNSKWAQYRGVTSLVQVAVDAGATGVQQVQMEMTDEIYNLIAKIPLIATPVKQVQSVHTRIVGTVYDIIRGVNYGTAETIKLAFEGLDSSEQQHT